MKLIELLNRVNVIQVIGKAEEYEVDSIVLNSNEAGSNVIFAACKGVKSDGHNYIQSAISNGSKVIIADNRDKVDESIVQINNAVIILVKNSRKSFAEFAGLLNGEPSKKLKMIGITGTKGKTTTTYFIRNIFKTAGMNSGLIGTNKNLTESRELKTKLTTPESNKINELLKMMVDEDCKSAVMEVSSHSIVLDRVSFLDFDYGIFTNISSDHLDYHQTFEEYLKAKKRFFTNLKPDSKAIINCDDESWEKIIADSKADVITYGKNESADFRILNIDFNLSGTNWEVAHRDQTYKLHTKLIGEFNAYNATAAFVTLFVFGLNSEIIIKGIKNTAQVPGRFEVIDSEKNTVIVDYSHTSDSLRQALKAIKHIAGKDAKICTVFGCGGNRDKTKRPVMGKIAEEFSSEVVITSDNPRDENPFDIIEDIKKGLTGENFTVIENRGEAIKYAIENYANEMVILIAGKGHENYQEIKGIRNYFSDKETAEKYLNTII